MTMPLTVPELSYLHRYFTGVGDALGCRMREGSTPSEPNLTFLLCELMDENITARHVLQYPLAKLNADLEACGIGNRIEIAFETNEYTQAFEGKISFADLGIVFERRDALGGHLRKAVLVQSKRLYHKNRAFSLDSEYEGYHHDQFENLKLLVKRFEADSAAYYFLYNPDLQGMGEKDQKKIGALETVFLRSVAVRHPELERFVRHFGWPGWLPGWLPGQSTLKGKEEIDQLRDAQRQALETRPGLRVCGLSAIEKVAKPKKKPRLRDFYDLRHQHPEPWFDSDCLFETFADFMILGIIGCTSGSEKLGLIAVAEGKMPDATALEGDEPVPEGVGARHTLRVKVLSTLGQGEG